MAAAKKKKKKPKVKLDNKNVILLSAIIVFVCACVLSVSFFLSTPSRIPVSGSGSAETQKKEPEVKITRQEPVVSELKTVQKEAAVPEKKQEPKQEVKKEIKAELKPEQKSQEKIAVREETKKEVKADVKPEIKAEVKKENKPVQKTEVKVQEKPPVKKEVPSQPKIASADTKKPAPAKLPDNRYNIPAASGTPRISFVIDDAGLSAANVKKYTDLNFPITIAVLPKLAQTNQCAQVIRNSGQHMILHQPMQALNPKMNPGQGAVKGDMSLSEIRQVVRENLEELGAGVKGLNNHEGSLITSDEMRIGAVLDVALEKGLYFLDSRTTKDTMAPQAALERDMKIFERDIFIDNIVAREDMLKEIYRGLNIANKKGSVIMIAHVDKSVNILPALLTDMYPYLVKAGYKITYVK